MSHFFDRVFSADPDLRKNLDEIGAQIVEGEGFWLGQGHWTRPHASSPSWVGGVWRAKAVPVDFSG
jgi:hypothetical protein